MYLCIIIVLISAQQGRLKLLLIEGQTVHHCKSTSCDEDLLLYVANQGAFS